MIIYPAIDLKDCCCVRLTQGHMDQDTVYNDDPAAQAKIWAAAGFEWLHIVDLNGAFAGKPVNGEAVNAIIKAGGLKLQLGGGIRNLAQIEHWLEAGIERIILGTAAVRDPALVREACLNFKGRIAIGIDARAGRVAVQGWAEETDMDVLDLAKTMQDAGAAAVIYTDIDRDGTGAGINMARTIELARTLDIPVIASGGAHDLNDIRAVKKASAQGVAGIIVGRAFYEGTIEPGEALSIAAGPC